MKKGLFTVLTFLIVHTGYVQNQVTVSAMLDKKVLLIGEQAQLVLQASLPERRGPSFFTIDSLAHFEILERSKIDTQLVNNRWQLQQTLTITSWDSGAWQLPAFSLSGLRAAQSKPIPVRVVFSPFDPKQPYHDIKDIADVPNPERITWYWYLVFAALLLLLFLLLFPRRKKKSTEATIDINAYKVAMRELDVLQAKEVDNKQYFTELVFIFRNYLQQRKGIASHAKTTDDLSRQLTSLALPAEEHMKLVQALQLSDFVKFAKYTPSHPERTEAMATIKNSITTIEKSTA